MIENKLIIRYIHFNQFELFQWLGGHLFHISLKTTKAPKNQFYKKIIIWSYWHFFSHHLSTSREFFKNKNKIKIALIIIFTISTSHKKTKNAWRISHWPSYLPFQNHQLCCSIILARKPRMETQVKSVSKGVWARLSDNHK